MSESALLLVIRTIGVAHSFDFLNGLHDAANSVAPVISTRGLSPQLAVLWTFHFFAASFVGIAVAKPISSA